MNTSAIFDEEPMDGLAYETERKLFDRVLDLHDDNGRGLVFYSAVPVGNKAGRLGFNARMRVPVRDRAGIANNVAGAPRLVLCPWRGCVVRYRNAEIRPEIDGVLMRTEEVIAWVKMVEAMYTSA